MKRLAVLALVSVTAYAQGFDIVGYVPNRDNNRITFTNHQGKCPDGQRLAYTQADGGKITDYGCYALVGDQLMVAWNDGDMYSYSLDALVLSEEFIEYMKKKR